MAAERPESRLLIVEDDPAAARLMEAVLRTHGFTHLRTVDTAAAAVPAAAQADIILLDYQLPDGTGLDILAPLRAHGTRPSVILVTAHGSEHLAAKAMRLGADDYLAKDGSLAELLPQVVERVRRGRALQTALHAAERDLMRAERLAAIGEMTVTLHHEINNPLMAATAGVDFLLHGPEALAPSQAQELREVQVALERIRLIVQRVGTLTTAPTRDYATGAKMIDLRAEEAESPVMRGVAGLWTDHEDVARVTSMLLRRQGWRVERCADVEELRRLDRTIGLSLLVLEARDPATGDPFGGFRPQPGRSYRIAVLAADAAAGPLVQADVQLLLPFDPHHFEEELRARFA